MNQYDFIGELDEVGSHRPMLWFALELTHISSLPVVEYGAGYGSTAKLRQYCHEHERPFRSYDNSMEWARLHDSLYILDWLSDGLYEKSSVVLIDQGPAEMRKESIKKLQNDAQILVIHDAEPQSESYRLWEIWGLFKYRIFIKSENIWTAAVSNHIDLTKYNQTYIVKHKLEVI